MARATKRTRKTAEHRRFTESVKVNVSACLERPNTPNCYTKACSGNFRYDSYLHKLHVNTEGFLIAEASCGSDAVVCDMSELGDIIAFLTKLKTEYENAAKPQPEQRR